MNAYAIFHKSESNFAFATSGDTLTITLRVAATDKPDRVEILYNNKYDFTKRRYACDMFRYANCGKFAYFRVKISLPDARFAYIFRITEGEKVYYFSEDGLTTDYDFKIAYYTFFQFPFINSADVMKVVEWTRSAVFYQIFIDRFARGDFDKDDSYVTTPWGEEIDRHTFAGGDIEGIKSKLTYLRDIGITALYLTPVFLSNSNHKYNVLDYLQVDPQFGDRQKLESLLCAAHERGMKVIIDTVFNHCDCGNEIFCDVISHGKNSKYYNWFFIDGDFPDLQKGNYAHFADCKYMPKWNTNNPATRRYLIDIALEYLKMGFDGLRLDVADEISHEMWRQLRREVKSSYPQALILGEIWHDNEHWLRGEQFDGVMNYKLQKILIDYFGNSAVPAKSAADRLNELLLANTDSANSMALNFLDNHDTPRFLNFTGGNKEKLLSALLLAVVFPGMPCVFYGTELPLVGGGDPDCRKMFDWTFKTQTADFARNFKEILGLKNQPALSGTETEIREENKILKITRTQGEESITAYFNTSGKTKRIKIRGEKLLSLNCNGNNIEDGGALVVKNKNIQEEI